MTQKEKKQVASGILMVFNIIAVNSFVIPHAIKSENQLYNASGLFLIVGIVGYIYVSYITKPDEAEKV